MAVRHVAVDEVGDLTVPVRDVPPLRVAVGVDVAEERKGLDLVALDQDRRIVASRGRLTVDQTAAVILEVLGHLGVDAGALPTGDRVDAALGGADGRLAPEGARDQVGDPEEGVILLPARATRPLPYTPTPVPPTRPPATASVGPTRTGRCGCGCGTPVRRRFLPGHDAKLKSCLLAAWRDGDATAAERLQDLGGLPD